MSNKKSSCSVELSMKLFYNLAARWLGLFESVHVQLNNIVVKFLRRTISFQYLKIENHLKIPISQSNFSGPRKFTLGYQLVV